MDHILKKYTPAEGRAAEILEDLMSIGFIKDSPEDFLFKMRLCAEEIVVNIVSYSDSEWVETDCWKDGGSVFMRFRDAGRMFNPLAKPDPDISAALEDRPEGGLGIFICKEMTDSIAYDYHEGCNVLTMSFAI